MNSTPETRQVATRSRTQQFAAVGRHTLLLCFLLAGYFGITNWICGWLVTPWIAKIPAGDSAGLIAHAYVHFNNRAEFIANIIFVAACVICHRLLKRRTRARWAAALADAFTWVGSLAVVFTFLSGLSVLVDHFAGV